jgi:hypothetical protein
MGKVWKIGYATDMTSGRINGQDTYCSLDGILSKEVVIIGDQLGKLFISFGDSGSLVFTGEGVCGVVFAGVTNRYLTCMTPIEDLLNRMKEVTGMAWELRL